MRRYSLAALTILMEMACFGWIAKAVEPSPPKPLLLIVSGDHCPPCHQLHATVEAMRADHALDSVAVAFITLPDAEMGMLADYNGADRRVPLMIVYRPLKRLVGACDRNEVRAFVTEALASNNLSVTETSAPNLDARSPEIQSVVRGMMWDELSTACKWVRLRDGRWFYHNPNCPRCHGLVGIVKDDQDSSHPYKIIQISADLLSPTSAAPGRTIPRDSPPPSTDAHPAVAPAKRPLLSTKGLTAPSGGCNGQCGPGGCGGPSR